MAVDALPAAWALYYHGYPLKPIGHVLIWSRVVVPINDRVKGWMKLPLAEIPPLKSNNNKKGGSLVELVV
jgi:hypothetical protein